MKGLLILLTILMAFAMMPILSNAEADQPSTTNPPISQPLIREGTLAVKLAVDLKLGTTENEAEAEDLLSAAGIVPRNGWIADYPVTPDIVGELQAAISAAAVSGKLSMKENAAVQAFQYDVSGYNMPVSPAIPGTFVGDMSAPSYPDSAVEDNNYESEGPPSITYYAPPPDYAYLYTWVPYPFWWTDFWFPGFFVLADFDVRVHWHYHGHDHDGFVTNHFHDHKTGGIYRIDPANRVRGGTLPVTSPATNASARAILERTGPGPDKEFRGYGLTPRPSGVRSSAFDHSVNSQVEHAASDRGFQSRSSAGQFPAAGSGGGSSSSRGGGAPRGGGFHGSGRK